MESDPSYQPRQEQRRHERFVADAATRLGLTPDEMAALVSDPERAPGIMARVRERFALSEDYDADGPEGLQLWMAGILTEEQGKWLDGVE